MTGADTGTLTGRGVGAGIGEGEEGVSCAMNNDRND